MMNSTYALRKFSRTFGAALLFNLGSTNAAAVMSVYAAGAGNTTEDISAAEVTGSSLHAAGGVFLSKDASLGENGLGLELTVRKFSFDKKESDAKFAFDDSSVGFCARFVPIGGITMALGRLTHDIKTTYDPESTLGSRTIDDGKVTGNFLSLGLAASFVNLQPYLDYTRYWLPAYASKIDEFAAGVRFHFGMGQ